MTVRGSESRAAPVPRPLQEVWSEVSALAEAAPSHFCPPTIDSGEGKVVARALRSDIRSLDIPERGRTAIGAAEAKGQLRVDLCTQTVQELATEADRLRSSVTNQPRVATSIDSDQITLVIDHDSEEVRALLRGWQGRASDIVLVTSFAYEYSPAGGNRSADLSPFSGGANIGGCSSAFGVKSRDGTIRAMVTAGHCKAEGGSVTSGEVMGSVRATYDENWSKYGSTVIPGTTGEHGDLALIRLLSGKGVSGRYYTGFYAVTPTTKAITGVGSWARGTKVCTSAQNWPYEACFVVDKKFSQDTYQKIGGELVKVGLSNVIQTYMRQGLCIQPGNSGALVHSADLTGVYRGKVAGVVHGSVYVPTSTGSIPLEGNCGMIFTDYYEFQSAFPNFVLAVG